MPRITLYKEKNLRVISEFRSLYDPHIRLAFKLDGFIKNISAKHLLTVVCITIAGVLYTIERSLQRTRIYIYVSSLNIVA